MGKDSRLLKTVKSPFERIKENQSNNDDCHWKRPKRPNKQSIDDEEPSIKALDAAKNFHVPSPMVSVMGKEKSFLRHALFRLRKSIQTRNCLFFFLRGTMFAIHIGYLTSRMNLASINLLTSTSNWEISFDQKYRCACLIG